jgi:hypothetical protein
VIIVDEANELMSWQESDPTEVRNLLSSLVVVSKQQQQCHVVLATSDYGFKDWLTEAIGCNYWNASVIGDFVEDHAREFLQWKLQKNRQSGTLDDAAWAKVYEVCGGNAGDLARLAAKLKFPLNTTKLGKDEHLQMEAQAQLISRRATCAELAAGFWHAGATGMCCPLLLQHWRSFARRSWIESWSRQMVATAGRARSSRLLPCGCWTPRTPLCPRLKWRRC